MTDEVLYEQVRRGKDAAFQNLYQAYRGPLFRFGYRLTGSPEASEDFVHDCFIGLLRGGFNPKQGSLRTYLYAAVRNLARKRFRDHSREDLTGDAEDSLAPPASPLDSLLTEETAGAVRLAVEALPLLQREVLILFEYEELSLDEIARVVGAETGAVKSRLSRARERLRKSLAPASKETAR